MYNSMKTKPKISKKPPEQFTIQKYSDEVFSYISHISDLHIPALSRSCGLGLLERRKEFLYVFQQYYQKIDELKTHAEAEGKRMVIVITGDLYDDKKRYDPEVEMLCRDFLKELGSKCRVIIIAGNHDMYENNPDRMDMVTPCQDLPNVYYLKYSGLYQFGEVVFCVSSLYDKKFLRRKNLEIPDGLKCLALYHGALMGSVNDHGRVVIHDASMNHNGTTRQRKVSDFDGFDAVLLGDIHAYQHLRPTVAYVGSMIQCNYGEKLDGHGTLVWDLEVLKTTFYPINNLWGHVQLTIEAGHWIDERPLPSKPYIRLLLKNTTDLERLKIEERLNSEYDVQGKIESRPIKSHDSLVTQIPIDELRNDDEIKLMEDELRMRNENSQPILELHEKYRQEMKSQDIPGMNLYVWYPIYLEFQNLFAYGNNKINRLNFRSGVTTICARNTDGKSSIRNIILFSLFGRMDLSSSNPEDVLNNRMNRGYVKPRLCEN